MACESLRDSQGYPHAPTKPAMRTYSIKFLMYGRTRPRGFFGSCLPFTRICFYYAKTLSPDGACDAAKNSCWPFPNEVSDFKAVGMHKSTHFHLVALISEVGLWL